RTLPSLPSLPSFPSRRSSDLKHGPQPVAEGVPAGTGSNLEVPAERPPGQRDVPGRAAAAEFACLHHGLGAGPRPGRDRAHDQIEDRKSTRLNSSHVKISYAVF